MNASHVSLRDDYDTISREVDVLVDEAWEISWRVSVPVSPEADSVDDGQYRRKTLPFVCQGIF